MQAWRARQVRDRGQLLAYLNTDRLYAAYAIGDLEPALAPQCTWAVAERGGPWDALALYYCGLRLPALFLMGRPDGVRAIFDQALYPARAYITCRAEHLPLAHALYDWDQPSAMWRMALDHALFRPASGPCERLGPQKAAELAALYAHGGGPAFSEALLEQGVFYGVRVAGRLVAVAGTHLVSETYGVAAVGNVFTLPDHRRKGYATQATSAVLADLSRRGIRDTILSVNAANTAAQGVYERLGFRRDTLFFDGPVTARWTR